MASTERDPAWQQIAVAIVHVCFDAGATVEAARAACQALDTNAVVAVAAGPTAPDRWYVLAASDLTSEMKHESASALLSEVIDRAHMPALILDGSLPPPEALSVPARALVVVGGRPWLYLWRLDGARRGFTRASGVPLRGADALPRSASPVLQFTPASSLPGSLPREPGTGAPPGAKAAWIDQVRAHHVDVPERAWPEAAPPHEDVRAAPPGKAPDTDVLHWNTTFPNDAAVQQARTLFAGVTYALRTWLGAAKADGSLSSAGADVSFDRLSPTGAPVDVSFRIEAIGAEVREAGSSGDFQGTLESKPRPCVKGKGTDPFDVELRATGPDRVELTLLLNVRNATIQVTMMDLDVVAARGQTAGGDTSGRVSLLELARTYEALARVVVRSNNGQYEIETQLGVTAARSSQPAASATSDIVVSINDARLALDRLSNHRYRPSGPGFAIFDSVEVMQSFMTIGRKLHATLFGETERDGAELRAMARAIAARGKRRGAAGRAPRLQVDAELLPIPWGLLYDGDENAPPDPHGFWGMRFQIDRLVRVPSSATVDPSIALRLSSSDSVRIVIDTTLDEDQKVEVVGAQKAFFGRYEGLAAVTGHAELKALLESNEPLSLLYFFCHAVSEDTDVYGQPPSVDGATLTLGATQISIREMSAWRKKPLHGGPLVFLNACGSAKGSRAFQSPFVQHFVQRWAARGVVGTEWEVPTKFADLFARRALQKLLDEGQPLGDAFHGVVTEAMSAGNPFGLIYAIYAAPELTATRPPTSDPKEIRNEARSVCSE